MTGIGIIGAGHFGAQHAAALSELKDVKLVAACRNDRDAIVAFTQKHGGTPYTDWQALLDDPAVDAVVIATPHHLHAEFAIAALQAGKHVLLEKPIAASLAECAAIERAAADASGLLMIGHLPRYFAPMLAAMDCLGQLGRPQAGTSIFSKVWMEANRQPWHLSSSTGGGMLATAGIHALDRLVHLMGSPVVSVGAMVGTRFHTQDADDLACLNLRFADGQIGQVASVGYAQGAVTAGLDLMCEHGTLSLDLSGRLRIGVDGKWREIALPDEPDPMLSALNRQWRAFLDAIGQNQPSPIPAAYGTHMVAILTAAHLSNAERKEISITRSDIDA